MANSKGKRPTKTASKRSVTPINLNLSQAEQMLPLVKHIAQDVKMYWDRLGRLEKEQADLDRRRHKLDWPLRSRRYEIADEINVERKRLQEAVAELDQLQVILVDPQTGEMAFPTMIHGRKAFYVWSLELPRIETWCYANEPTRRVIPNSWRNQAEKNDVEVENVPED